jgi:hypothetical protein
MFVKAGCLSDGQVAHNGEARGFFVMAYFMTAKPTALATTIFGGFNKDIVNNWFVSTGGKESVDSRP